MINILLPMAGSSGLADEMKYPYPSPLIEIKGSPMIERIIANLMEIDESCRLIVLLRSEDCRRFHLDNTLKLLIPPGGVIIKVDGVTKGALCSSLLAVSHINNEDPLIIANSDQIFRKGVLASIISEIKKTGADAGCPYFPSVHPRWSYLQIKDGLVVEAAEKNPISRNAVAGIYYFSAGSLFVEAGKRAILSGRETDGMFYISSVLNELVLDGRKLVGIPVDDKDYYSFFTPQRIEEFDRLPEFS